MSLSNSLSHYHDVREMLDDALVEPAGVFCKFETTKSAHYWRRRAHQFRRLLIRIDELEVGAGNGSTPYDDLVMTLKDTKIIIKARLSGMVFSLETGEVVKATATTATATAASLPRRSKTHYQDLVIADPEPANETKEQQEKRYLTLLAAQKEAKEKDDNYEDDATLAAAVRKERARNAEREAEKS